MALLDNPAGSVTVGRKTVTTGGTAEALGSGACISVVIQAETDNTGIVVVGDSTVVASLATREGIALSAGESISLAVNDLGDIYLDVTVNGDGATYLALSA